MPAASVTVRLPESLRQYAPHAPAALAVDAGSLAEVLGRVDLAFPGIAARILDDRGRVRRFVHVFVEREAVGDRDPATVRVPDGATVHVLPSVAGGAADADVALAVGTGKGLFLFRSRDRASWERSGPHFAGLPVYHATVDPRDGTVLAGVSSEHWGPSVQRSTDFGATWETGPAQPRFPEGSGLSVDRIWQIAPGTGERDLWVGVEPAGLFHSPDGGRSWTSVDGFNLQPGRDKWMPGFGGLCMHTILPDARRPERMVVAASAVSIFRTDDGGKSWAPWAGGVDDFLEPAGKFADGDLGSCPHKLVRDAADPDLFFMQNHRGVYRRRWDDPAWVSVGERGAGEFGFPVGSHPREGGTFYTVPLEGDFNRVSRGGAFAVARTRDAGASWERLTRGLPQDGAFFTVLRDALAVDALDPAGVYVGTRTGQLYHSRDEGDSWALLAEHLPPVLSVRAAVLSP